MLIQNDFKWKQIKPPINQCQTEILPICLIETYDHTLTD